MSREALLAERRAYAATILAADVNAAEGLLAGQSVPRHRLHPGVLVALDEPTDGRPIELNDELALRVELIRDPVTVTRSAAPAVTPEPASWLLDAAALLGEPDPGPTRWLVEGLIVDQAVVAVAGRWKTTKSYGVLDLCISIATGRPAFGVFAVEEPGRVVFVNEESGRAALWRRLDALCRGRATTPESLRDRLFVAANARVKLDDADWQARLIEHGVRLEPRLFVFDPLARMKAPARKENAQEDMAEVIEYLRELRNATGAAVLFVHHTGHQGEHMRGSSDLESAWESRLRWKRDGQSPEVTIENEHREAEGSPPFKYRIVWDGLTRSMRFEAVEDPLMVSVREYLEEYPDASANAVHEALQEQGSGARKTTVLALVKTLQQGGSHSPEPPGTTPPGSEAGGGSPGPPFRGPGTTPTDLVSKVVPLDGNHPSNGRPLIGDEGYLERMFAAFEAELITEGEWRQAERAHRFVAERVA